jgi:hypothetical protein
MYHLQRYKIIVSLLGIIITASCNIVDNLIGSKSYSDLYE